MAIKYSILQFTLILFVSLSSCKSQNDADYYYMKGVDCFESKQFEEALGYYNKAISIDSNNTFYFLNRGATKDNLGFRKEAYEDYKKSYQLDSLNILANFYIALILGEEGEKEKEMAITYYNRIIRHYPSYYSAYYAKAVVKYEMGDYKEALEEFAKYLSFEVNDPGAYYYMGMCSKELGNTKTAIEAFGIAVELGNKEAKEELEKLKEQ